MAFYTKLASPKHFYRFSGTMIPWLAVLCLALLAYGLIGGLLLTPPDYQQGDAFRIIYVHVPSASMSMVVYGVMTCCALSFLIWKVKLADMIAKSSVVLGVSFTFLALLTGSLWGKPMWGTWWIWDARLTSELILLFIYLGIIALRSAIPDRQLAAKACSILTLVGAVDLPIIHYSVYWWNTLHQKSTLLKFSKPSIAPEMLYPLLAMLAAFFLYYLWIVFIRVRAEIIVRERQSDWVKSL